MLKTLSIRHFALIAILMIAGLSLLSACQQKTVSLNDFWARIVPAGNGVGAVYGVVVNQTDQDVMIIDAESPLAGRIELHTHGVDEQGIMRMRRVPNIAVAAHDKTEMKPGSLHIMLFDLKDNIEVGQSYPLILSLNDNTTLTTDVLVQPLSYAPNKK